MKNTVPLTQANFDALMEAMEALARRVAILERTKEPKHYGRESE